jgi:acetate kinase
MGDRRIDLPVLVLNAGSSSLKYQVVDPVTGAAGVRGVVERIGSTASVTQRDADGTRTTRRPVPDADAALVAVAEHLDSCGVRPEDLSGIGHRVVHGGADFTGPVVIDDDVLRRIEELRRLAPLHNPPAAAGIRSARDRYPTLGQVAVFDTAFFADLPARAATYALPHTLTAALAIRRYGMHGTSHAYVAGEAARFLGRPYEQLAQIVLHLGNGASAAAVRGGVPLDTSMGLTPLEGLVMGTRAGDLDPGVLVHLMRHGGLGVDELEDLLHRRSGLAGMSGHQDFRDLLAAVDAGDARAQVAYELYCQRIRKYVGAYLAVLGGADVLTFTAGIGENASRLRRDALAQMAQLGIEVDRARNEAEGSGPRRISTDASRVTVLVVPTNEELAIARQVVPLLT